MTQIQWYPGHMAKAKKEIKNVLPLVDITIQVVDARVPGTSLHHEFAKGFSTKPQLLVLNKKDLADPEATKQWLAYYENKGFGVIAINAKEKQGIKELLAKAQDLAEPTMQALEAKGRLRRPVRAMVVGAPNTGKSTLINALLPRAIAKTANKPGVTRGQQWIRISDKIELMDTPGILWPKLSSQSEGYKLALVSCISSAVYNDEEAAHYLISWLQEKHPNTLDKRYKIEAAGLDPQQVLEAIGKKRGLLAGAGEVRLPDVAALLLAEFRNGLLGAFTLDKLG